MSLIISISLLLFDEIILSCLLAISNIFSFLANRCVGIKKQHRTFDYPMLCNLSANLGLNIACYTFRKIMESDRQYKLCCSL